MFRQEGDIVARAWQPRSFIHPSCSRCLIPSRWTLYETIFIVYSILCPVSISDTFKIAFIDRLPPEQIFDCRSEAMANWHRFFGAFRAFLVLSLVWRPLGAGRMGWVEGGTTRHSPRQSNYLLPISRRDVFVKVTIGRAHMPVHARLR